LIFYVCLISSKEKALLSFRVRRACCWSCTSYLTHRYR